MEEQKNNISTPLKPKDYTDLGETEVFVREYGDRIRYSEATSFLVYDGVVWRESDIRVQELSQELTRRQLEEAQSWLEKARAVSDQLTLEQSKDKDAIKKAKEAISEAESYRKFVLGRRASTRISATMKEAIPSVYVDVSELDADAFLLNTPGGRVDLRTGAISTNRAEDLCTKITGVKPGKKGKQIFEKFLDGITKNIVELKRYLQEVVGTCTVGAVKREEMFFALGSGGNGKSTFFNLLLRVMGDYGGMISTEALTVNNKNKGPELAELRGKRLVVAAELGDKTELDTSALKKICSTDMIHGEKKYKAPFDFWPSHHTVLYTNFLPKVSSNDDGTWDRLVVIPFDARFRGQAGEIKDYASYLFEECGEAVLQWIIDGAKRVISNGFKITKPQCVLDAVDDFRSENDWLNDFIKDSCILGRNEKVNTSALYEEYKNYCIASDKGIESQGKFNTAIKSKGIVYKRTGTERFFKGLRIKTLAERADAIKKTKEAENAEKQAELPIETPA